MPGHSGAAKDWLESLNGAPWAVAPEATAGLHGVVAGITARMDASDNQRAWRSLDTWVNRVRVVLEADPSAASGYRVLTSFPRP
ncbi:hypothetical protein [Streptomyces chartreusis]|uniref:hypothetical protein n=1 Tax=Streptomyces chartreusis TaxID=1969 RepID=UPI00365B251E